MDHRIARPFHLAFTVTDLAAARAFYLDTMGCPPGRRQSDRAFDFCFFGQHLIAHLVDGADADVHRAAAAYGQFPVRHFGAIVDRDEWNALFERLSAASTPV